MKEPDEDQRARNLGCRDFCTAAGLAIATFAALSQAAAQEAPAARPQVQTSEAKSRVISDSGYISGDLTSSKILAEPLIRWRVSRALGLVDEGIDPIIEVRHEEAAAFMAGGEPM